MNITHRYEGVRVGIKDMDWKFEVSEGLVVYIEFLGGVGCCSRCERTRRIRIVRPGRHLQFGIIFLLSDMNDFYHKKYILIKLMLELLISTLNE